MPLQACLAVDCSSIASPLSDLHPAVVPSTSPPKASARTFALTTAVRFRRSMVPFSWKGFEGRPSNPGPATAGVRGAAAAVTRKPRATTGRPSYGREVGQDQTLVPRAAARGGGG